MDYKEINQSILKEINPMRMLKLKLQYFGHMMPKADSLEMTLLLGKTESKREKKNGGRGLDG